MATGLRVGSVTARFFLEIVISPTALTANVLSIQTYTVPGLFTDMALHVSQEVTQANLALLHARVSATNTMELIWFSTTNQTPTAAQTVQVIGF